MTQDCALDLAKNDQPREVPFVPLMLILLNDYYRFLHGAGPCMLVPT